MKMFPVLGANCTVPFDLVKSHEDQVFKNHGQSIERLAERGGLGWEELACVIKNQSFDKDMSVEKAKSFVNNYVYMFNMEAMTRDTIKTL